MKTSHMVHVASFEFPASAIPDGFGAFVATERRAAGWTQQRLADEAGLKRETIVRLEAGSRRPTADTVFRIESALDLMPGALVPGWPEWKPIGSATLGAASRERRRALGLSLAEVAAAAGVSIATLSRFEREIAPTPSLARFEFVEGMPEAVAITKAAYSRALGFRGMAEHRRHCIRGG